MTPKEKALQLWNKIFITKMSTNNFRCEETKLCALIVVDEILKVAFYATDEIYNFYLEVKQEIEKL